MQPIAEYRPEISVSLTEPTGIYDEIRKPRLRRPIDLRQQAFGLRRFEKSYRIGLLTNGDSARQWAKIHSCGLCTYFDHIIVSGDYPFEKPDPAIYRLSLEGLGVTADEALFVGDTVETDIDGAKQAGIDSLWLTEKKENTAGATYLAENVGALMNLL